MSLGAGVSACSIVGPVPVVGVEEGEALAVLVVLVVLVVLGRGSYSSHSYTISHSSSTSSISSIGPASGLAEGEEVFWGKLDDGKGVDVEFPEVSESRAN